LTHAMILMTAIMIFKENIVNNYKSIINRKAGLFSEENPIHSKAKKSIQLGMKIENKIQDAHNTLMLRRQLELSPEETEILVRVQDKLFEAKQILGEFIVNAQNSLPNEFGM